MQRNKLRKLFPLLRILQKLTDVERDIVLCYLNNDGCAGIYECIHNAIHNTSLTTLQKEHLQKALIKDKKKFRLLIKKEVSPERKQNTLKKVGGGVGVVLETLLPLLENYVNKKRKAK
jgi:hypothetical protein